MTPCVPFRPILHSAAAVTTLVGACVAATCGADEPGATKPLVTFSKQRLDDRFFAEGAGVGDFNKDGVPDLVAGPFWFAGPMAARRRVASR
jgi:hypothetical protein